MGGKCKPYAERFPLAVISPSGWLLASYSNGMSAHSVIPDNCRRAFTQLEQLKLQGYKTFRRLVCTRCTAGVHRDYHTS